MLICFVYLFILLSLLAVELSSNECCGSQPSLFAYYLLFANLFHIFLIEVDFIILEK